MKKGARIFECEFFLKKKKIECAMAKQKNKGYQPTLIDLRGFLRNVLYFPTLTFSASIRGCPASPSVHGDAAGPTVGGAAARPPGGDHDPRGRPGPALRRRAARLLLVAGRGAGPARVAPGRPPRLGRAHLRPPRRGTGALRRSGPRPRRARRHLGRRRHAGGRADRGRAAPRIRR